MCWEREKQREQRIVEERDEGVEGEKEKNKQRETNIVDWSNALVYLKLWGEEADWG